MNEPESLHSLTHTAIETLQHAFQECGQKPVESYILSAIVSVKMLHDILKTPGFTSADIDPEEYCSAV